MVEVSDMLIACFPESNTSAKHETCRRCGAVILNEASRSTIDRKVMANYEIHATWHVAIEADI